MDPLLLNSSPLSLSFLYLFFLNTVFQYRKKNNLIISELQYFNKFCMKGIKAHSVLNVIWINI